MLPSSRDYCDSQMVDVWQLLFSVKSEAGFIYLNLPCPYHSQMHALQVSHDDAFFFLLCIFFPFQEQPEDKQYPQKRQGPLLSHLQPLSPGQTHMELRRYYSICQDTAFGPAGFPEGEGELKKLGRTRNSLSPTMAPKLSLEVRKLSNGRLSTSLKLGPLQARGVPLREKKATQMLAIVLGEIGLGWVGLG